MADLVKTTITIPEDILKRAKLVALQEKTTLSEILRDALKKRVYGYTRTINKDPLKFMGAFSIGIKKIYNKRSDLYEEHLKRKMGY